MASLWFVRGNGKVYGPFDDARLRSLVAGGKINEATDVATQAGGPWHPAARVRGLFRTQIQEASAADVQNPSPDSKSSEAAINFPATVRVGPESLPLGDTSRSQPLPGKLPRMASRGHPTAVADSQKCPSCDNECALNARACPQCGYRFPNNAPFIIGGLIVAVLVVGGIAATIVHKREEEADIWRDVHRQSRERQEKLQSEISEGYKRLGDKIIGR